MLRKQVVEITVEVAVEVLSRALRNDPELAWTWHCSIAGSCQDSGSSSKVSNESAARFMKLCFRADTSGGPPTKVSKLEEESVRQARYAPLLAKFSLGDWIVGLGEHKGLIKILEVYGFLQPFEHLQDFNPDNYRLATDKEIATEFRMFFEISQEGVLCPKCGQALKNAGEFSEGGVHLLQLECSSCKIVYKLRGKSLADINSSLPLVQDTIF